MSAEDQSTVSGVRVRRVAVGGSGSRSAQRAAQRGIRSFERLLSTRRSGGPSLDGENTRSGSSKQVVHPKESGVGWAPTRWGLGDLRASSRTLTTKARRHRGPRRGEAKRRTELCFRVRVLIASNATSRRAPLLSAGAPQVPRARGRPPGWNRSSRTTLLTSQPDYTGGQDERGCILPRGSPRGWFVRWLIPAPYRVISRKRRLSVSTN